MAPFRCMTLDVFTTAAMACRSEHYRGKQRHVVYQYAVTQMECLRDLQASAPPELEPKLADLCGRAQQYDALSPDARRALLAEVVPLLLGPLQRCALSA